VNIPRKGNASRCKGIICFNYGTSAEIPFWIKTNEVWYSVIGDSVMYYVMYQRKIVTDGFHCHRVFPRTSTIVPNRTRSNLRCFFDNYYTILDVCCISSDGEALVPAVSSSPVTEGPLVVRVLIPVSASLSPRPKQ